MSDDGDEQPLQEEQPPQAQPSLDSLPDDVLSHIFVLTGAQEGRNLPLVSHRWQGLYFGEQRLWDPFVVSRLEMAQRPEAEWDGWLASRVALAQRVGQHVTSFVWRVAERPYPLDLSTAPFEDSLPSFLAALQPDRLTQLQMLSVQQLPAAAATVLARLTGIGSLSLDSCGEQSTAAALTALRSGLLHTLACIFWRGAPVVEATLALSRLTSLVISTMEAAPLQQLTRLSQLRVLGLVCGFGVRSFPVPEPASFPAGLDRFTLSGVGLPLKIAGALLKKAEFNYIGCPRLDGGPLEALRTLLLSSVRELPSLPRLLDALLPPKAPPLARLVIRDGTLDASCLQSCPQLQHWEELHLLGVQGSNSIGPELAAFLQQMPRLATLQVLGQDTAALQLEPVLPHLSSCSGLTRLALAGQWLPDLPDGSYLTGLQSLSLLGNQFRSLPAALAAATELTFLDMALNPQLDLSDADVETLVRLPSLRQFNVQG